MAQGSQEMEFSLSGITGVVGHRHPNFNVRVERILEGRRYDPDYPVDFAIEDEPLRLQIGITTHSLTPELLVYHCEFLGALPVFAFRKRPTGYRIEIEDFEEIRRYECPTHAI